MTGDAEGAKAIGWRAPDARADGACVFIDRDGVVNERVMGGFVLSWGQFKFRPDAVAALLALAQARLPVVVVSNQSCVGRGLLGTAELVAIMDMMTDALARAGAPIAAWYCCPHAPDDGCDCRKPHRGMLVRAARELDIDLARSHMIGDTPSDIAAGEAAGCATHLIDPSDAHAFARVVREIV